MWPQMPVQTKVRVLPWMLLLAVGLSLLPDAGSLGQPPAAASQGVTDGHSSGTKPSRTAKADIPRRYLHLYRTTPTCPGLKWTALAAVGKAESNHGRHPGSRHGGASSAVALGPMQFMPGTWRTWGRGGDIYRPEHAIPAAARYLCAVGAGQHLGLGAAAYNAGPGAVRRYGGIPPYPETRAYVERVLYWNHRYQH